MIDERMAGALNKQINEELFSAYLYMAMSADFESKDLSGFAHWMQVQAQEEMTHALKIYNFLNERGAKVIYEQINTPQSEWESPVKAFSAALSHEIHITSCINKLVDLASELRDHTTISFLNWFLDEQVEEESTANELVKKLELAGNDGTALLMLDKELSGRVFVNPLTTAE